MKLNVFARLHELRMQNDDAGNRMAEMRSRFDRIAGRHENGTAPRAVVVYQLFQTPVEVATRLISLIDLQPGERVLEPSAGLGRLLDAVKPFQPSEVVAVEKAAECAAELFRQDRAGVVIKQRDFLEVTNDDIGLFDVVVMNPPFHMRSDIKHIKHALTFLKPGGRLAAICMEGPHRDQELRPLAREWIDLGPGVFKESGTNIGTAMMVIDKPAEISIPATDTTALENELQRLNT